MSLASKPTARQSPKMFKKSLGIVKKILKTNVNLKKVLGIE